MKIFGKINPLKKLELPKIPTKKSTIWQLNRYK